MGGDKKKGVKGKGKGKGKKKNGKPERRSGSPEWVGKHKVLVRIRGDQFRSKCFVVDLQLDIIEMENPYKLLSGKFLGSEAVVREEDNIVLLYHFGGFDEYAFNFTDRAEDDDRIHPYLGTSKSVLNLKTNPPTWSAWKNCSAKTTSFYGHPLSVTLGNKIFSFGEVGPIGQVYDTAKHKAKWEDITNPFLPSSVSHPITSDPNNNRLILYFEDIRCLYAYYPDNVKETQWECLFSDRSFLGFTAQVVDDVIYFFISRYTIRAYDIPQRKWLNVSWPKKNLEGYCHMYFCEEAKMMHLGDGMMCLAMSNYYPPPGSLEFLRFRVSRRVAHEDVQVTPISCHRLNTPFCGLGTFTPF